MLVISRDKSPSYVITPARHEVVATDTGSVQQLIEAKRLIFAPFGTPFKTKALPVKYGRKDAAGFLNTKRSKQRPGMTETEAIDAIFAHPSYGVDFVAIGDDGMAMEPQDDVIVRSGDGKYCNLCEQQLNNRGLHKHLESKKHLANLEEAENDGYQKIRAEAGAA